MNKIQRMPQRHIFKKAIAAIVIIIAAVLLLICFKNSINSTGDVAPSFTYNGYEYVICSDSETGEQEILEECGLPGQLTSDLAGTHVGWLEESADADHPYSLTDEETDRELFAYAPVETKNVFILCENGQYYAAIRRASHGYHGLYENDSAL